MATISNHHDETVFALSQFNLPEDISYKIAHFASVYADNPNQVYKVGNTKIVVQWKVAGNNLIHKTSTLTEGSSVRYFCMRPATFYCSSEDKRNVNYDSTSFSQENTPLQTVRHAMLSTSEEYNGISAAKRYGKIETEILGLNGINTSFGFPNIRDKVLKEEDFYNAFFYPQKEQIERVFYRNVQRLSTIEKTKTRIESEIKTQIQLLKKNVDNEFSIYLKKVNQVIASMSEVAKNRGIRFGWEKIFKAAEKAKKTNFLQWDVDESDSLGESGLALLGVGIHAIQDAIIHKGESMETIEGLGLISHIEDDENIGDTLKKPTFNAVLIFLLVSGNFSYLKPEHTNNLNINELGLVEEQVSTVNLKIKEFDLFKFKPISSNGSTISSGK